MSFKPVAIVLGGSAAHAELILRLKEKGYHVTLVDYLDNPPSKKVADDHVQISTLDKEKVLEVAKQLKAQLVINTHLDPPLETACYVSEQMGLPIPYSYDTSVKITNKSIMKRVMLDNDIQTAPYFTAKCIADLGKNNLHFPLIVKPTDSTGTLGVSRVDNQIDLEKRFGEACKFSRAGEVVIEEFCEGAEWNVYCFIIDYEPHVLLVLHKYKLFDCAGKGIPISEQLTQLGTVTQYKISKFLNDRIKNIAKRIAVSFNIRQSPLLIQTIVDGNDVSVIEAAARLGGTGLSDYLIREITGVDILEATIQSYFGITTDVVAGAIRSYSLKEPDVGKNERRFEYAINFVYAAEGVFERIEGVNRLFDQKLVQVFHAIKSQNMVINEPFSSRNRVAFFIVKAEDRESLFEKVERAMGLIDVLGANGKSIMRRDLFLRDSYRPFEKEKARAS